MTEEKRRSENAGKIAEWLALEQPFEALECAVCGVPVARYRLDGVCFECQAQSAPHHPDDAVGETDECL